VALPPTSEKRERDSDLTQGNREKEISTTKNLMSIYTSGRLKQALVILLVTRKNTTVKATRGKFDKRTHSLSLFRRNYWWNRLVSPNANFLSQKQYTARMIRQSDHSRSRLQTVYARHEKLSIPWLKTSRSLILYVITRRLSTLTLNQLQRRCRIQVSIDTIYKDVKLL
jgi:hypothetical protein